MKEYSLLAIDRFTDVQELSTFLEEFLGLTTVPGMITLAYARDGVVHIESSTGDNPAKPLTNLEVGDSIFELESCADAKGFLDGCEASGAVRGEVRRASIGGVEHVMMRVRSEALFNHQATECENWYDLVYSQVVLGNLDADGIDEAVSSHADDIATDTYETGRAIFVYTNQKGESTLGVAYYSSDSVREFEYAVGRDIVDELEDVPTGSIAKVAMEFFEEVGIPSAGTIRSAPLYSYGETFAMSERTAIVMNLSDLDAYVHKTMAPDPSLYEGLESHIENVRGEFSDQGDKFALALYLTEDGYYMFGIFENRIADGGLVADLVKLRAPVKELISDLVDGLSEENPFSYRLLP